MTTPPRTPATDRMPPLPLETMDPAQRAAAEELIAGPRKAVRGPFIPLMRSPELLTRIQKVGEVLRFHSVLPARLTELATLVVARTWTQQFEWTVHVPLALQAGVAPADRGGATPRPATACSTRRRSAASSTSFTNYSPTTTSAMPATTTPSPRSASAASWNWSASSATSPCCP